MSAAIGGQAVLEGVMMRSPSSWAVAVRKPDGAIAQVVNEIASPMAKRRIWRLPSIRGVIALGESLAIGFRALAISANYAAEDGERRSEPAAGEDVKTELSRGQLIFAFAIAMASRSPCSRSRRADHRICCRSADTGRFVIVEGAIRVDALRRVPRPDLAAPRPAPRLPVPRRRAQGDQRLRGGDELTPEHVQSTA